MTSLKNQSNMYFLIYYCVSPLLYQALSCFCVPPHYFTLRSKRMVRYLDGLQKFLSNPADRVREAYWHPNSPTEFTHDEMMVRYRLGFT